MTITMTPKRWGIVAVIMVAVIAGIYVAWPTRPPPVDIQAIVDATAKEFEAQYQGQLKEKETAMKDLKSRLLVSEARYKTLAAKYIALQKEKDDVKPPQTDAELRERFIALGFAPLPGK